MAVHGCLQVSLIVFEARMLAYVTDIHQQGSRRTADGLRNQEI
jgi:hypothetical protein